VPPVGVTRRAAVAGIAAALAAPPLRRARGAEALPSILGASGLGAHTGFALLALGGGRLIEAHQADRDRPPASVAKMLTALYALDRLGPDHRFRTELVTLGPVEGGRLGGLGLRGTGDPGLDTDGLGALVAQLRSAGVAEVAGPVVLDGAALPDITETEPDQPDHAGYNPAISGLNLNYNRVFLEWRPGAPGPVLAVSAPGTVYTAPVRVVRAELGGVRFVHRLEQGTEVWRVPPALATGRGSAWLPVRRPPAYAGDVLAALAAQDGVTIPAGEAGRVTDALALAERQGERLSELLAGMLHHSTNLTAEVVGLTASGASDLAASAASMTDWTRRRFGLVRSDLVNHSGLSERSSSTAAEIVRVLAAAESAGLPALLRERPVVDAAGDPVPGLAARVRAKTGTLHWVRGYAGYLDGRSGRYAFAILAADPAARSAVDPDSVEPPPGARDWGRRARNQEAALLRRWAALYA
jgi:D-alanyl-D-alanine carboxypeptidase/D-alanyl-D-alanine-endopeptidase (penicillin-binding protein 4)